MAEFTAKALAYNHGYEHGYAQGRKDAAAYMERQVVKHRLNHDRELARGASEEILANIRAKIAFYEAAAEALRKEADKADVLATD